MSDVFEDAGNELSGTARLVVVQEAFAHWRALDAKPGWCDQQVGLHVRSCLKARRAARITSIKELTAGVGDFTQFDSGAQLGAWLG